MDTIKCRVYPAWWTYASMSAMGVFIWALINGYTLGVDIMVWRGMLFIVGTALTTISLFSLKNFFDTRKKNSLSWALLFFSVGITFIMFPGLSQSLT